MKTNEEKKKAICGGVSVNTMQYVLETLDNYIHKINSKCLPLLKDLRIELTIKNILRYSCEGGKARLRADFAKSQETLQNAMYVAMVEERFEKLIRDHFEFEECANEWRYNKFLFVDDEGSLSYDQDKVIDSIVTEYYSDPTAIEFAEKVLKVCEILSGINQEGLTMVKNFIYWDNIENKPKVAFNGTIERKMIAAIKGESTGIGAEPLEWEKAYSKKYNEAHAQEEAEFRKSIIND